jgi:hypothetical protein
MAGAINCHLGCAAHDDPMLGTMIAPLERKLLPGTPTPGDSRLITPETTPPSIPTNPATAPRADEGALSAKTAKLIVFKLVDAARENMPAIEGRKPAPKGHWGIKFQNGIEVKMPAHHPA